MKSLAHPFAAFTLLLASGHAAAEVIYSGLQDLAIPATYDGIYLDVDGGLAPSSAEFTGWDFNPYMGGLYVANNTMFQPARTTADDMGTLQNFAVDTTVGAGLLLGTGMGGSIDHLGTTFSAGQQGYLGFKLNGSNYGWMRVVFTNNTGGAKVLDWAYDNTNGAAIATGNVLQSGSTVTLNSALGSFTLGSPITGSNNVVKAGANSATLSGTHNYSGATAVNAGKLVVGGSIGSSAVTVTGAGTILASGATATIGNSVVVNNGAILAAGDAAAAGTATVTTSTTFNNGSIFSWDINQTGTSYDKLVSASLVDGDAAGGAVLRIVASDALVTQNFWNTAKTWTDLFTTNGSTAIANWANIFTTVSVVNRSFTPITPTGGFFSASGSTLTWTAVPEPTSALAAILLGAGLLRRRRP